MNTFGNWSIKSNLVDHGLISWMSSQQYCEYFLMLVHRDCRKKKLPAYNITYSYILYIKACRFCDIVLLILVKLVPCMITCFMRVQRLIDFITGFVILGCATSVCVILNLTFLLIKHV